MNFTPFDFRTLVKQEHPNCEIFVHQAHKSLYFPIEKSFANDGVDQITGTLRSKIFTDDYTSPICYTVKVKDCLIGPRPEGVSRYWPIFFGENYAFNFMGEQAKNAFVKQKVFTRDLNDNIEFDKNCIAPIKITEPCVWLYTFYNIDHLIRESLPAILALKEIGVDIKNIKFVVPNLNNYGILEILNTFGIPMKNIIQLERQWIQFSEVYIPSFFSFGHLHTPSKYYLETAQKLKELVLLKKSNTKKPKRIFVSRQNAGMRRLLNEKYLYKSLIQRGFDIIEPGELTKLQQVEYFSSAELVVGQHGMGIANAIFAENQSKIIEIMHTNYNRVSYFRTAQVLRGMYGAYYVDPIDLSYAQNGDKFGDVVIKCDEFIKYLDEFI